MSKRVLLDENLPHKLRSLLVGHEVFTVAYMQWIGLRNGDLLKVAEEESFDVLITSDQGFPHQQNIATKRVAVLLVSTPDWNVIQYRAHHILAAIDKAIPGTFLRVDVH